MHLVVFDVDGTLVDSEDFDGTLYARAIWTALKIDIDEDWSGYRHQTDSGILNEVLDRNGIERDHSLAHASVKREFISLVAAYLAAPQATGCRKFPAPAPSSTGSPPGRMSRSRSPPAAGRTQPR